MDPVTSSDAWRVAALFAIEGRLTSIEPHDRGHIHRTFISSWEEDNRRRRFLHQRMNDHVFTDIPALMHNVELVTSHLRGKPDCGFQTLVLVPTRLGRAFLVDRSGPWRTYEYVESTESFDRCRSPEQAHQAALAFGHFQSQLTDLDINRLRETIPNFFSSPHRLVQFEDAMAGDPRGRVGGAAEEVRFALARRDMVDLFERRLTAGAFPRRVVHGDTKLNNVLFESGTDRAVCVVDLDTCMPAWSLYDFGDLVRFTAATSSEDETDLELAGVDLETYQALAQGYLAAASSFLTKEEVGLMPAAASLVTLTVGLRFLTDYLSGDSYFRTTREHQNLDRARVQFAMVRSLEEAAGKLGVGRL
ncbi:MAG TPA: aminoglycoside phosphotransferase family protein [Planctomycetota bacterium]|nr:aminoglycoside phosphotransferase family protein [Planctomycetota bacterium]